MNATNSQCFIEDENESPQFCTGNHWLNNIFSYYGDSSYLYSGCGDSNPWFSGHVSNWNCIYGNTTFSNIPGVSSWSNWLSLGFDLYSILANPLLVNPGADDLPASVGFALPQHQHQWGGLPLDDHDSAAVTDCFGRRGGDVLRRARLRGAQVPTVLPAQRRLVERNIRSHTVDLHDRLCESVERRKLLCLRDQRHQQR